MKFAGLCCAITIAFTVSENVYAQQLKGDLGKREYDSNCAVCHGESGKGDGPYASLIQTMPVPNLAELSKKNNGVFPFRRVYETIDGTQTTKAHGTTVMPIWGKDYQAQAGESYYDDFRYDPAAFVRARILALTEYIYRLQAK